MILKWCILSILIIICQITNVYSENNEIFFIVNPAAGNHSCGGKFHRAESRYLGETKRSVHYTEENKSAAAVVIELISKSKLKGHQGAEPGQPTLVVAVGGDAIYAQVAKALQGKKGYVIGILPFGTGNDTARGLGIPVNNARRAIEILTQGEKIKIGAYKLVFTEAGGCEEWAFQEVDVGMSEDVGQRRATLSRTGSSSGCFSCQCFRGMTYTRLAVQAKLNWNPELLSIRRGESVLYEAPALFIAMTTAGYSGGGYKMTPQAGADNGQLIFINNVSFWNFIRLMPAVKSGNHIDMQDRVFSTLIRDGEETLTIKKGEGANPRRRMRVQIDGEPTQYTLPVDITWHRDQVPVMAAPKQHAE